MLLSDASSMLFTYMLTQSPMLSLRMRRAAATKPDIDMALNIAGSQARGIIKVLSKIHAQLRGERTGMRYAVTLSFSRRRSCCYLPPSRHHLLLRHRAHFVAEVLSLRLVRREVVGEAIVVAPEEDFLLVVEGREVVADARVCDVCIPRSDLRPCVQV